MITRELINKGRQKLNAKSLTLPERGDEEYHRGNFSAAISYYTKAIALSGSNPFFLVTLFTNRAVAHIHLKVRVFAIPVRELYNFGY